MTQSGPKIEEIRDLAKQLAGRIVRTPLLRCNMIEDRLGNGTEVFAKLEFLQRTGTFKARGALATLAGLSRDELLRGVTAVSAGNHAIATAFAAKELGSSAKVVMTSSANPARVATCRSYGAEVVIAADVHAAFAMANKIRDEEGRFFVHPFDGPSIARGTGTMGLEICEQLDDFDAVVIPVGGGGLISGAANAIRKLRPDCEVIGVEPEGADSMHRSFAAGEPRGIEQVGTIADSLGAPFAMPYSFTLTRDNVQRLSLVSDDQLRRAMGFLFQHMNIAVEPACAATTAALFGPLRKSLAGKRVVLVYCGSNIDWVTFSQQVIFEDLA
jgi:threonine dehydratase